MKIFIIEDETVAAQRMLEMVREIVPQAKINGPADSIEESVQFLRTHPMPDLILMDIELVDGQSFEIFGEVEVTCPVIFTTAYDEFALQAFKVHSIDYLLKPIQREDLQKSLRKFQQLQQVYSKPQPFNMDELLQELRRTTAPASHPQREHFLVRQGQRLISISTPDIAYFYSEDRVTFLKTHDGRFFSLDYPLEEVEQQVDSTKFFRASRQYLVQRRAISDVFVHFNGKYKLALKPTANEDVYVSRDRAPDFKKWLGA
ncbi:LytR/AlgR family response regulator transcription factor [Adhaeribacter radiodurans]|uniref:Response regulator transcription factor n=1 Tax=Adhaeribacter radiodurans TaxID=2745197 RepID=A0A7L7L3B7_9BACT|nr:LytTR family DNA-binding domain-containing protein [Adhaeribacter radiodurans]QMU27260.1 response regulator transcription factor [Adhaeribacter radiodurans]